MEKIRETLAWFSEDVAGFCEQFGKDKICEWRESNIPLDMLRKIAYGE